MMQRFASAVVLAATIRLACPLLAQETPLPAPEDAPWNVLLILTDQHHYSCLGEAGNGFGGAVGSMTPNLDALAERGVLFDRAYTTAAQCSPARYSLMTGQWPEQHGLRVNKIWEPANQVTVAEILRGSGYATAHIGKHHFFWLEQPEPRPTDHGFDLVLDESDYRAFCQANNMPLYTASGNHYQMPNLPGALEPRTGYTFNTNEFHPAGYWADQTMDFLDERAADQQPFFCVYSMVGPHTPIMPTGPAEPEDWAHRYFPFQNLGLPGNLNKVSTTNRLSQLQGIYGSMTPDQHREVLAYYYGFVAQIDYNIGRVLERLSSTGLQRRTLVIFTSDHGESAGEMGVWTKGSGGYEALTRVPLVASLPGIGRQGKRSSALVSGADLVPTILELTGAAVEPTVQAKIRGRSLLPFLLPEAAGPWRQSIFSSWGADFWASGKVRSLITDERLLVVDDNGPSEELYDLVGDPWQLIDQLPSTDPLVLAERDDLLSELNAWWDGGGPKAPLYQLSGKALDIPGGAQEPSPVQASTGVSTHTDLRWLPSTASVEQSVYLGVSPTSLQLAGVVPGPQGSFNPGALLPGLRYYWSVEGRNANGPRPGPLWFFDTDPAGTGGPALARPGSPLPFAQEVPVAGTSLQWFPGQGGVAQDLWLAAKDEPLALIGSGLAGAANQFQPVDLQAGLEYRWRVDGIDAQGHRTAGTVWSFATSPATLPSQAARPSPRHMTHGLSTGVQLSWTAGRGFLSQRVHFGTDPNPPLVATQANSQLDPGGLLPATTYYWRVDEVGPTGVRRGWTWRFRTHP